MTDPSTSREQIVRQAKDLGCEIPRDDARVLIVRIAAGRDLTVLFDRAGRIREAAYDTDRNVRRGIRPARVGAVLGVLFSEVYTVAHPAASSPERGTDAFDEIERSDAAAAQFERDPQGRTAVSTHGGIVRPTRSEALSSQRRVLAAGRMPAPVRTYTLTITGKNTDDSIELTGLTQPEVHRHVEHALLYRLSVTVTPEN